MSRAAASCTPRRQSNPDWELLNENSPSCDQILRRQHVPTDYDQRIQHGIWIAPGLADQHRCRVQYNLPFYLQYLAKWPEYSVVAEGPGAQCMGYILGKAEGTGPGWHGHVTAVTVAPEFRRAPCCVQAPPPRTPFAGLTGAGRLLRLNRVQFIDDVFKCSIQ